MMLHLTDQIADESMFYAAKIKRKFIQVGRNNNDVFNFPPITVEEKQKG